MRKKNRRRTRQNDDLEFDDEEGLRNKSRYNLILNARGRIGTIPDRRGVL
jgi:hypothetical protein